MREPETTRGATREATRATATGLPVRFEPDVVLAIALGGALGAPARYGVAQLVSVSPSGFPWATFWTNLSGAFVLGVFLTVVLDRLPPNRYLRPFFGTGFLGAYTTFSTLAVETTTLVKDGHPWLGIAYTLVSIACGLGVAYLGVVLGRMAGREAI
jgi:CrcB protein